MWSLAALVLVSLSFQSSSAKVGSGVGSATPMKKYIVDLDLPPEERWSSILQVYNNSVPLLIEYFSNEGPKIEMSAMKELLSDMDGYFGEYGLEMKGIADFFEIDLGIVVTLNMGYELRRLGGGRINTTGNVTHSALSGDTGIACTSILAINKSGNVFHGRTLDWQLPVNMRNLTIEVDFVRGGEVVFTGDVIVGTVGVGTGISRKGGFSISINERNLGGKIFQSGINALLKKSKCPTLVARELLTTSTSFVEAVETLTKVLLVAPVYYIIAGSGLNEGAVITRARDKCIDLWLLESGNSSRGNNTLLQKWYLLETNYDHWKEPEPYDNRRGFGIQYLNKLGQDIVATAEGMESLIAMWPIRNNYTSSSALMIPGEFLMQSSVVYPDPN